MKVIHTDIEGILVIEPIVYGDERGCFFESFNQKQFHEATGLNIEFVQDNESLSRYGVIRGFHYQRPPFAQSKLVRCVKGRVLDVAVDIRSDSATFGKYVAVELSQENHRQLFVPNWCAHGFAVLSPEAVLQYKCDEYYCPEAEGGIAWNDEHIKMQWPISNKDIVISEKDKQHPSICEALLSDKMR